MGDCRNSNHNCGNWGVGMTDVDELVKDMRSGKPIEEVLKDHNLTFKQALHLLQCANDPRKGKRKKKRVSVTGEQYISKMGNRYYVRKTVGGKSQYFGMYATLEDAIKIREYMNENGWYKHRLKTARRECGLED